MIEIMKSLLEQKIKEALTAMQQAGQWPALTLSKSVKKSPMEIAELLKDRLFDVVQSENSSFQKIEVVAPGYINVYLSQKELAGAVEKILQEGETFGGNMMGAGVKVNNEFISANPTGPLTVGNGRGGFYTDSLANVLRKAGYAVTNEYYVNDAGEQVLKLGHSVLKDSEAVYGGEYIDQLTKSNQQTGVRETGEWAAKEVLENMIKKSVAEKMQIHFDVWTSEKQLIADGYVEKAVALLKEKNLTFEQDGALWLRTTQFGDDKDRVLTKSDGTQTYFASDCGYILSKMERGFTLFIETWGADHHGYIGRFKAAAQALGFTGNIHFLIVQLVKVVKDGVEVRMSKRAGNVVTIDELIETVGHDVARFFFLMYAPETHMNFDLGLAEERSQKNPVYYVQYAHARLSSILRKAEEEGLEAERGNLTLLTHEKERGLIRELLFFPELIEAVATDFSVHKLPQYAMRLADKFHSFYDVCRVIDVEQSELTKARLQLVRATRAVLAETLTLMGISAPERM
jgi:arginyl-tRNA synthetase